MRLILLVLFSLAFVTSTLALSDNDISKDLRLKDCTNNEPLAVGTGIINCENLPSSPLVAPSFVGGSLFAGFARNSIWLRASINMAGTVYFVVYTQNQPSITAAIIKTHATTAGAQVGPDGGTERTGGTGNQAQSQIFTAAQTPSTPSFTGTPYAGARFVNSGTSPITNGVTYYYYIVAENTGTGEFSAIVSGSGTAGAQPCTNGAPGSNQSGSDATLCGPRDVQMNVEFTNLPYADPYTLRYEFFFDYETQGFVIPASPGVTAGTVVVQPTLDDPLVYAISSQKWKASANHTYADNGTICAYTARAVLSYYYLDVPTFAATLGRCTNVFQDQTYAVYDDLNNTDLGQIAITPDATPGIEVCEGSTATVSFDNTSTLNCIAPEETEIPNQEIRWYQWEYGINSGDADFMDKVEVIVPPGTPGYPLGATITTFPFSAPVQLVNDVYPYGVSGSPLPSTFDINVLSTNVFGPDNTFQVRLRMWNVCNPYDEDIDAEFPTTGLDPENGDYTNGDEAPVTTTSQIVLVQQPVTPTAVAKNICQGGALPTFEINFAGTSSAVRWYDDNAGVMGALLAPAATNSKTLPANTAGITPAPSAATPGVYAVWAQYQLPTTGIGTECFSDPIRTTITVKESLTAPTFVTAPLEVCANSTGVTYQLSTTAGSTANGGTTSYTLQTLDGSNNPVADFTATLQPDGTTILVDFNLTGSFTTRTRRLRVTRSYTSGSTCAVSVTTSNITVYKQSEAGALQGGTSICLGDVTPTLSFAAAPVRVGTITKWQRSFNGGAFSDIPGTAGLTTFSETPIAVGTYDYQVEVINGPTGNSTSCLADYSGTTQVIVRPVPVKPSISASGATIFCDGGTVTLTASNVDGNAASYRWYRGGVNTGVTTASIVADAVGESGSYTVEAVGIGTTFCTSPVSDPEVVTIQPLPSASNPIGGGAVCGGSAAPNIVWNLTGRPPFDITYEVTLNGGTVFPVTVLNYTPPEALPPYTFTISAPNPPVNFAQAVVLGDVYEYQMVSLEDDVLASNPSCTATALGSTETVSIGGAAPAVDEAFTISPTETCDDGASTTNPVLDFSVDLINTANFTLSYRINGLGIRTKTFNTDAVGDPTGLDAPITFTDAELNAVGNHTIRIVSILSASGCLTTVGLDIPFDVHPLPSAAVSNGDVLECSDAIGAATVSVIDPDGAGDITIDWYDAASGGAVLANGTGVATFDPDAGDEPAAGTEVSYFAESRNDITGCVSTARTEVRLRSDLLPSVPTAMANDQTCNTSFPITATPADNNGTGYWSTANTVYYENFNNLVNGTTTDGGIFGWSRNLNGVVLDPGGYLEVRGGKFESDGLGNNVPDAFWESESIDISALTNIDISLDLYKDGDLETPDYIQAYYVLDGGAEVLIGGITRGVNDGPSSVVQSTVSVSNLNISANTSLVIRVRMSSNTTAELQGFDNLIVKNALSSGVLFDDIFDPTTNVTNLQDGPNVIQWNVISEYGVCALTPDPVTITKIAEPIAVNTTDEFCEETLGSGNMTAIDLATYDATITGGAANRAVTWFTNDDRTVAVGTPGAFTATDGLEVYALVTETLSGLGCVSDNGATDPGKVAFTIFDRPTIVNQTDEFCEDALGTSQHAGVNLNSYNAAINATATITWFEAYNAVGEVFSSPVATPAAYTVSDGQTLFARVVDGNTCVNVATLDITVHSLPDPNNIIGPSGSFSATVTVCKSNTIILFQLDPDLNDRGGENPTYDWIIPTAPGTEFELFGGGGTGDFFVLLKFPNAVPGPGLALQVRERTSLVSTPGCQGAYNTINIIVEDSPAPPVILGVENVCVGQQNVQYTLASSTATSTYEWDVPGAMGPIISGQGDPTIIVNIGPDVDGAATTFTPYQISVKEKSAAGCNSIIPDTHDVRVHDSPTVSVSSPLIICSGTAPNETVTMSVPGSTFTWEVLTISASLTGANAGDNGTGDITHVLTNSSNTEGLITYRITAFSPDIDAVTPGIQSCQGQQTTLSVRVEPVPQAVAVNNAATICNGGTPNFSVSSPTLPTDASDLKFNVTVSLPLGVTATGIANTGLTNVSAPFTLNAGTITNANSTDETVVYTITPLLDGCANGPVQTINVVVEPTPVATVVNNTLLICDGDNVDLDISSVTAPSVPANLTFDVVVSSSDDPNTGGTAYADLLGQTFTPGYNIGGTLTNASDGVITVTFTITPKLAGCVDGTPVVRTVQVEPTPRAVVTNSAPLVCNGGNANISITNPTVPTIPGNLSADITVVSSDAGSTGGTAFTTLPLLNQAYPINITGTLTNSSDAVITLTYTITPKLAGCASGTPIDVIVEIEPTPEVVLNNTDLVICNGGNAAIAITTPTVSTTPADLQFDVAVSSTNGPVTGGTAFVPLSNQSYPFNINGTLTNSSNSAVTVEFAVTPELNGTSTCADGSVALTTVQVEPTPVATALNNTPLICDGGVVDIDVASPTAPTSAGDLTFDVVVSSTDDPNTGGTAYADLLGQSFIPGYSIGGTLTNASDVVITVTFTITPKLAGCADGTPVVRTVQVEPTPRAVVTNSAPLVCNGGNANISITNPTVPTIPGNLSADITVVSSDAGSTGGTAFTTLPLLNQAYPINITGTLTNSSDAVITLTYTITPKLAGCASGTPIDVIVEIEPTPEVVLNNTDLVICNGGNAAIAISTPTVSTTPTDLQFDVAVSSSNGAVTGGTAFAPLSNQSYPFTINGTLTNSSNTFVTVQFTVTPELNGTSTCADGTPVPTTVQVEPTPVATALNNTPLICDGGVVDIDVASPTTPTSAGDLTFDVVVSSSDDPNTGGTAYADLLGQTFTPGYDIGGTLTNASDVVITVTFTITPKLAGCADGTPVVRTVQVEPTPRAVVTNSAPVICTAGNANVLITSPTTSTNAANLRFDVVATSSNAGATGGTAFGNLSNVSFPFTINGTLTNSSDQFITVTYEIKPKLTSCTFGPSQFTTVEVEPTPKAVITNTTPRVCTTGAVSIAIASPSVPTTPANLRFSVAVSSTNAAVTGGTAFTPLSNQSFPLSILGTLTNSSNNPITVTFSVTPTLSGCSNGSVVTTTVIVEPTPLASFVNNLPKVCNNGTPNITITSPTTSSVATDQTFDVSVSLPAGVTGTLRAGNGGTGLLAPFSINTGILTNTNASFQTVTYTITPMLNGCANGPIQTVDVIVEPTPTAVATNNIPTICNNGTPDISVVSATVPSVLANLTFDVAVSLPPGVSGTGNAANAQTGLSSPFSINTGTLVNSTTAFKTVTYTITPRLSGCVNGPTQVVNVVVEPTPQAIAVNNLLAICSGSSPSIDISTTTTLSTGTPTFDVAVTLPGGITGSGIAGGGVIGATAPFSINTGTLTHDNTTNLPLTVTYTITPKVSGCPDGPVQTVNVSVRPLPVGVLDTRIVCSDESFSYDIQSNNIDALGNAVSSKFTFDVTSSDEVGVPTPVGLNRVVASAAPIAGDFINKTEFDVNVTYTITPLNNSGNCAGVPFTVIYTIRPEPKASALIPLIEICSQDALNFDLQTIIDDDANGGNDVPSTFTYTVTSSNPGEIFPAPNRTIASQLPITDSYTNTSDNLDVTLTYVVTPMALAGNCPGAPFNVLVLVHPEPVGDDFDEVLCGQTLDHDIQLEHITNVVPSVFTYTVTSDNVGVPAAAPRVAPTNAKITDAYTNNTGVDVVITYLITPFRSAAPTCEGSPFEYKVTLSPTPVGFDFDTDAVCSSAPFDFDPQDVIDDIVGGGNGVSSTFTWTESYDIGLVESVTGNTGNIDGSVTNKTTARAFAEYEVTPKSTSSSQCVGLPFTIRIPIDPQPVIDPSITPRTICSDVPTNIVFGPVAGTITANNFDVTLQAFSPDLLAGPANTLVVGATATNQPANRIELDSYTNDHRTAGLFVEYLVKPNAPATSAGICTGDALMVRIEVLPEPKMDGALASLSICSNVEAEIELESDGISVLATGFYLNSVEVKSTNTDIGGTQTVGNISSLGNAVSGTIRQTKDFILNDKFRTKVADATVDNRTIVYNVTPASSLNTALPNGVTVGCLGDPFDIELVIKPEPVIDPVFPSPVCSDEVFGIVLNAETAPPSVPIAEFSIAGISFDAGLVKGSSNTNIGDVEPFPFTLNDQYSNTTTGVLQARYVIVPKSNENCIGEPDNSVVVNISPAPAVANGLDEIVCSDAASGIQIRDTESVGTGFPAQSFVISRGSTAGLTVTNAPALAPFYNGTDMINAIQADQFVNPTNNPIDVVYTVNAWSGVGATLCESPDKLIVLTVEPAIVATPVNINPEICSGELASIRMESPSNPTPFNPAAQDITFNVTIPSPPAGVTGFSSSSNLSENFDLTQAIINNNDGPVTLQYSITPRAASAAGGAPGCTGSPALVNVLVQPRPKLIADANETICEDDALAIAFSTTTSPTSGAGYGSVEYEIVSISNLSGAISGNSAAGSIFPAASTLADVLSTASLNQEVISYSFRPRFAVPGAVEASAALPGYCVGTEKEIIITVSPRAELAPPTNVEVCSGEEFTQSIVVNEADPSSTLITWTRITNPAAGITGSSNGAGENITQVLFNSTNDVGNVTYTFTPKSFSCVGPTATLVATVLPTPKIVGLASSFDICNEADFEADLDSFSPTTGATFTWTVDNTDPLVLGSTGGAGTMIDDTWENLTGSLASVTYTILPIVEKTDGTDCEGPVKIVSVNVAPVVGATLFSSTGDNDDFLCEGSKGFVFFENIGLPAFELTYETDNGSAVTTTTLTKQGSIKLLEVTPTVTTTYTVLSVKDAFGCEVIPTTDNVVTVNVADTDAAFSLVGDVVNCSPFKAEFAYDQQNGVNYNWKWFNGDPDSTYVAGSDVVGQTVKHIFENPAPTATVKYKVFLETSFPEDADPDNSYPGGCFSTSFKEVQVYPTVAPAVFADKTEICSGEEVRFVNTSQGVRSDKFFYRVQGSGGELEPRTGNYTPPEKPATSTLYTLSNLTGSNPLVLEVVYQSANLNCPAPDVVIPIIVYRGITADFITSTPTQFIGGHSFVDITNTSNPVDATDFSYEWNFGLDATPADLNGTTPPNPIDYTSPGLKEITLLVTNILAGTNGLVCTDEIRKTITITVPPLVADFDAIPLAACFPTDITIVENRATGDEFEWEVIDEGGRTSATSNANLPIFAIPNPGKYTVFLTTRNSFTGDAVSTSKELEIFELPTASFEVRPTVVFIPDQEITSFNFSSGANQYEWDFGDGNISFDFEPTFTYKIEGEYPITLIAGFNNGSRDVDGDGVSDGSIICYDTLTRTVQAKDGGVTRIPNSFTPNPNGPNGGNAGSGSFNDVFLPITKGVEEFMMQVFDRWGNLVFESREKDQGWDGYHRNGSLMPAGVYVYKLELRLSNGQRTTQVGDITLIR